MIDSRLPSGEPLQFVFEEIKWQQELSWEEATRRLEVAMYPFKKVRLGTRARVRLHGAGAVGAAGEHMSLGCVQGLLQGPVVPGEPLLCHPEFGGGIPHFSNAPSHTHAHTHSQHMCIHTLYILHTNHTRTYTLHTQPLNGTLASHSSFFLSRLGPRSPTCHSSRPSTKPRPRTSWCTRSCCGGPWTTSPAEVRETWPVQGENGRGDFTPCGYRRL